MLCDTFNAKERFEVLDDNKEMIKLVGGPLRVNAPTPSYKEPIPGSEQPFLETYFFLHFLLRLSRNEQSRVISIANFGPTASNLCYDF